jgi:hypothetical protein
MSLTLSYSKPQDLDVKTLGLPGCNVVLLGDYQIPMEDFCEMVKYVLTNTDLEPEDPRLELLEFVKGLKPVDGWNNLSTTKITERGCLRSKFS